MFVIALAHVRELQRKNARFWPLLRSFLSVVAIALGFLGFGGVVWPKSLPDIMPTIQTWSDAFYRTAGLLTLRLPVKLEDQHLPWTLQVARWLLPLMGVWISVDAYLRLMRARGRFLSLFKSNDHVIVVGPGLRAHNIARQCRADANGRRVVYVTESEEHNALLDLHELGIVIVRGSPVEANTYIRANLKRASAVILAGDRGMDNIRSCTTIRDVALEQRAADLPALSLVVAIDSPEMTCLFDASFHEIRDSRIEYRLLDPMDNVARSLTHRLFPVLGAPDGPFAIVLIGWSGPAPAIFRRLVCNAPPGFQLLVVDRNAEIAGSALLASAPGLAQWNGLRFITAEPNASVLANTELADAVRTLRVGAIIVSGDSDETNFRIAIQLRRFARTNGLWTPPIHIRQQGSDSTLDALKLLEAEPIDVSRIRSFGSLDEQYASESVLHGTDEMMARAVHQAYLKQNPKPGPNTKPWDQLGETFRSASRLQAENIEVKLVNAGCRTVPGGHEDFRFTPEEVERLAMLEHWRWCVDRWFDGWTYSPQRNDQLLKHDMLVPYEQLPERIKDYDRQPIRNIPELLGLANRSVRREKPIMVADGQSVDALAAEAKTADREGMIPIFIVTLDTARDLERARDLQALGLKVRLVLKRCISGLGGDFSRHQLTLALDAADDVVPAFSTAIRSDDAPTAETANAIVA